MTTLNFKCGDSLFIVLAVCRDGLYAGRKFVYPAYYLNEYPLEYADGCGQKCTEEECPAVQYVTCCRCKKKLEEL